MHLRFARAAVAAPAGDATITRPQRPSTPTLTLWSSRPFAVRGGHLVAVRLRDQQLSVRLIRTDGLATWIRADQVLSEFQAQLWVKTCRFRR